METLIAYARSTIHFPQASLRRIIFIHVPKTGGLTAQHYLTSCLGGKRRGRKCKLKEICFDQPPTDREIEKARRARLVCGHFSWASLQRMGLREDDYIFTFLREPRSRLYSSYRFTANYPQDRLVEGQKKIRIEKCRGMSPLDFFTTTDLELLSMIDNCMVRQLSGRLLDYPVRESQWPELLKIAKRNLRRLNHIGFQETYEADFGRILHELKLPRLAAIPRDNVTDAIVRRTSAGRSHPAENPTEVMAAMTPLVRWDQALYEYARQLRFDRGYGECDDPIASRQQAG
jgi:hypothetical protein